MRIRFVTLALAAFLISQFVADPALGAGCGAARSPVANDQLGELKRLETNSADDRADAIASSLGANRAQCLNQSMPLLRDILPDLGPGRRTPVCSRCLRLPAVNQANTDAQVAAVYAGLPGPAPTGAMVFTAWRPDPLPSCYVPAVGDKMAEAAIYALARDRAEQAHDDVRELHQSVECVNAFVGNFLLAGTSVRDGMLAARDRLVAARKVFADTTQLQTTGCVSNLAPFMAPRRAAAHEAADAAQDLDFLVEQVRFTGPIYDATVPSNAISSALVASPELGRLSRDLEGFPDRIAPWMQVMDVAAARIQAVSPDCPSRDSAEARLLVSNINAFFSALLRIEAELDALAGMTVDLTPASEDPALLPGILVDSQSQFRQRLQNEVTTRTAAALQLYQDERARILALRQLQ